MIARKAALVGQGEVLLIECKHYPQGTVGAPTIRALVGARASYPKATGAVLVTSGTFTGKARKLAAEQNVDLVDGAQLKHLLRSHGLTA